LSIAAQPAKKLAPAASRVAGRYNLLEELGEGGMGVVWRAQDEKTGAQVAIKIMKDVSDPAAVELFAKEWRALAELCHPNIVDVRDVDVLEEYRQRKPFFVMPLLRGATLAELIHDGSSRLTVARVVEIMSQVCRGLQAAHDKGLVHRDLKPSNIFVMSDDTAKIIDFGVVYLAGSNSVTGQKGTFQYMSPEQVQMKEITPCSDIFALGVILYEALTGRKPFAGSTVEETVRAVLKQVPPPVSEINASIPQAIGRVVHKCLAKSPMHRYSSARDVSEALGKALRNEGSFDVSRLQPRLERIKAAFRSGDEPFASEMLAELESEGHVDAEITVLRMQIDTSLKQKKIRQLLESARARVEQDEIALGLDKLRELLELDPENTEALALRQQVERQRSEALTGKWIDLAQTHLANRDFAAARQAVQEAVKSRNGDARAMDLMQQIENVEAEAKRVREQKEQLYNTAMRSYQQGEIDSALSKLVRLFSVVRSKPEAAIPERDAVYESFYKEVRSEHDRIHALLEEAQHQFSEKNFDKALALCNDHLSRFPSDGVFQALKIQIEDAERQEISAYIATVSQKADAEPDLDRRVDILREAAERYPGEPQFAQQLKFVRERRDLVNAIVTKARQMEERSNYAEALSQWDILRNIHPRFPGLAFELEQCRKKRDRIAAEEEKGRLVDEIVALMDARLFPQAVERVRMALTEFPADTELLGLEKLATAGQERSQEARRLFEQGQQAAADHDWSNATELLRDALRLDPRNAALRDAVVNVLTERARTLVEEDWREAEKLYHEADELDTNHRAVRALRANIQEIKRQTYVGECLTVARGMVASGDLEGALRHVREARKEYPKDSRLEQFESNLQRQVQEKQHTEERDRSWGELAEARRRVEKKPDSKNVRNLLELSQGLRQRYAGDPDTGRIVADAEQAARRATHREDLSDFLSAGTSVFDQTKAGADPGASAAGNNVAPGEGDQTVLFTTETAKASEAKPRRSLRGDATTKPAAKLSRSTWLLGTAGAAAVLGVLLFVALGLRHTAPQPRTPSAPAATAAATTLHLNLLPADSTTVVNGTPLTGADVAIPAGGSVPIEVSHPGYKTAALTLTAATDPHIALAPEPLHLWVQAAGRTVQLDGRRIAETDPLGGLEIPQDNKPHTLTTTDATQQVSRVDFTATPGSLPRVTALHARDLLAVASLGDQTTLYGGDAFRSVVVGDHHMNLSAAGTALPPIAGNPTLRYGSGDSQGSLGLALAPVPSLIIRSLGADTQMLITSNAENATLTMNGAPQNRDKHGWEITAKPGKYTFLLSADGFEPQTWSTVLHRGEVLRKNVALAKKTAPAITATSLLVTESTPHAVVELDDKRLGELDDRGSAQFNHVLTPGRHVVTLRAAGLCGTETREVQASPSDTTLRDIRLSACGSVQFDYAGRVAIIKVRRKGEAAWAQLPIGKSSVAPGLYELAADAEGLPSYTAEFEVKPGATTDVPLKFPRVQSCGLQDPAQATSDGDWMRPKNAGSFLLLRPGCMDVQISFTRPKGGLLGLGAKRHVQWEIIAPDGASIQYVLEDQKISRKVLVGGTASDEKEGRASSGAETKNVWFAVRINADGPHLRISNEKGETLDEYTATNSSLANLSSARLGLKTNAPFALRSDR